MQLTVRLGQRLRARRSQLGFTLMAVATRAGLSIPYIANLEKGRGNPTLDVIANLADALDVSPAELLGGDDPGEEIDGTFLGLAPVLVDYAQGKTFEAQTARIAAETGRSPEDTRRLLVRAVAAAPSPPGRALSKHDVQRLLDAYQLILTDPDGT